VLAIGNAVRCLAAHPDQWALLHERPAQVRFAVDEALRYDSPFQSFFRTTGRAVDLHGVSLAEDTKVALFVGAANRDPRRWGDDADEYRITRDAGGHLAFGMGIHHCVGQPVTRLEAEVLLTEMATRIASIELTAEPRPFLHNTLRGWTSIPVRVHPA
jgi:cytochrome P450